MIMMRKMKKIIGLLPYLQLLQLFRGNIIIKKKGATLIVDKSTKLSWCRILLDENTTLEIGKGCVLHKAYIYIRNKKKKSWANSCCLFGAGCYVQKTVFLIEDGYFKASEKNIFQRGNKVEYPHYIVTGTVHIGNHNRFRNDLWVRYGGQIVIGDYTNVNEHSEIRCDEYVRIGSFNQISYNVMIWDTNTHVIYPYLERRKISMNKGLGYEYEKPVTSPVIIGDDCWIGQYSSVMKGTIIGNKCIVGYHTLLVKEILEPNTTVISKNETRKIKNNI